MVSKKSGVKSGQNGKNGIKIAVAIAVSLAFFISLFVGIKSKNARGKAEEEQVDGQESQEDTLVGTNYEAIQLNTMEDMYELFDMSLNIIFAELVLEEVPMPNAYDDNGKYKGSKNTYGVGSTYSPLNISEDYNNPDAIWYHIARNPKSFWERTLSYQEMIELVVGWGKYRTKTQNPDDGTIIINKTVLERMFEKLKGCALRPNEFAAVFCAVYNNENNITNVCPYIKDNCANPIVCANKIMTWHKDATSNAGTKDRCEFETLVYLNADDFCAYMMNLCTQPMKTTGYSCIYTKAVTQKDLSETNYVSYSKDALYEYGRVPYNKPIYTRDVCVNSGWVFKNPLPVDKTFESKLQSGYNAALGVYGRGDYAKALELFLDLEKQGACGADLWNDIALTYYKLNQYDNCIAYCKKVLTTTAYCEYAKTCYNAGKAYEAKGDYDRAILNYDWALKYYQKYGISNPDSNIDYEQIYKNAKDRAAVAKKPIAQIVHPKAAQVKENKKEVAARSFFAKAKNHMVLCQRNGVHRTRC